MSKNAIIDEIHKRRAAHARRFHYDVHAICEDLRRKQALVTNLAELNPVRPAISCVAEAPAVYRARKPH